MPSGRAATGIERRQHFRIQELAEQRVRRGDRGSRSLMMWTEDNKGGNPPAATINQRPLSDLRNAKRLE